MISFANQLAVWRAVKVFRATIDPDDQEGSTIMFTIQMLKPSGDTYLLWWDGDTITAYAGPLHHTDEDRLHDDPNSAYDWELDNDPDDLAALNQTAWQFPTFRYIRR